jgi:hypothetical protein
MTTNIRIDFAVVNNQVDSKLEVVDETKQYTVDLDNITMTEELFKTVFFDQNVFYVNPLADNDPILIPFVSFNSEYRTKNNGAVFSLLNEILGNYCKDAGVPESSFTPTSLIGLNKQIGSISSLYDVYKNKTAVASLDWTDIINIIKSAFDGTTLPEHKEVILTLSASFIPKPSNTIVFLPTVIKFNYKVDIDLV